MLAKKNFLETFKFISKFKMECVIPARYIRLFAKSIQCMAKIGEEMFIEATEQRVKERRIQCFNPFSLR
jgi:hypothetical protein